MQLVSGFGGQSDGVAYFAHIGGCIAGLVLTLLLRGLTRAIDRRSGVIIAANASALARPHLSGNSHLEGAS